jgi:Mrp family chromosome partitioning ATPase
MAQMTGEFPRPIARSVWLTARARNAMHRPLFIGAVGFGTFVAALVALILAPQQAKHVGQLSTIPVDTKPDTAPFLAALSQARTRLGAADASLASARMHAVAAPKVTVDTLGPALTKARDSLSLAVNDLGALLTRVESAPLAASYRALAESPQMVSNPRVKLLLDSLAEVERDREAFGTSGGADPVYVALTARAAEIGQAIETIGQSRRETLRDQISKIITPGQRQAVAESPAADTIAWTAERDSAQSLVSQATAALADARTKAASYDRQLTRATEEAKLDAPPVALLASALVFGVALGFGAAFLGEMRHPRVSDEHEVERLTGARVLATIQPRAPHPERKRRAADRAAPPFFDPGADGYQLTYLHVARAGASRMMLTLAGEDAAIVAVVAMNVAAIAADEARSTVIVDTDSRTSSVAASLRIHAEPGLTDIMDHRVDWPAATSQVTIGRDRTIDVIPSGISVQPRPAAQIVELFRQETARLARHYEAIVIVASVEQVIAGLPGTLPIPDTILCARVGHTRISVLRATLDRVRTAGGNPLGVVLWNAGAPSLPRPDRIAHSPRPVRTAEMKALTGAR